MVEGAALEKRFSRKETWVRIPPSPPDYAKASDGKPVIEISNGMRTLSPTLGGGIGSATRRGGGRSEADEHIPPSPPENLQRKFYLGLITLNLKPLSKRLKVYRLSYLAFGEICENP